MSDPNALYLGFKEMSPSHSNAILRKPFYFGSGTNPLFGWYHSSNSRTGMGIVICPPLGHEYVHSHRSLRHLADQLAMAGFPALRFDYHGSGDSSGLKEDADRIPAWLDSIREAIRMLKDVFGCVEIGLVGLRMGATLAGIIASECEVKSLVLWEPCARGRRFVREMKALHLTAQQSADEERTPTDDIEAAGFVLTKQTADGLAKLDLTKLVPNAANVLICARDDVADDFSLRDAWVNQGILVQYQRVSGYVDMVAEPHFTVVPTNTINQIVSWIRDSGKNEVAGKAADILFDQLVKNATISKRSFVKDHPADNETADIVESIFQFGQSQELFGLLSQPAGDEWKKRPTVVLLNSGSVHHVGPHRLYVLMARQLSQMGFRCLRMDFGGIGDSVIADIDKENHPYTKTASSDTAAALRALSRDFEGTSFVLMGLCSGAHATFHAGLDITAEKILECFLINPLTFYWKEGMSLAIPSEAHHHQWNDYMMSMKKWDRWLKLLRGGVNLRVIIRTLYERVRIITSSTSRAWRKKFIKHSSQTIEANDLSDDLNKISAMGRQITFVFADTDPGYDLLMTNAKGTVKKLRRQNKLTIDFITNADHTFSAQAARQRLIDQLVRHFSHRYL